MVINPLVVPLAALVAAGWSQGIDAPEFLRQGTPSPVGIAAPTAARVIVTDVVTGERLRVAIGSDGLGRFDLPTTAPAGEVLVIADPDDPTGWAFVQVIP